MYYSVDYAAFTAFNRVIILANLETGKVQKQFELIGGSLGVRNKMGKDQRHQNRGRVLLKGGNPKIKGMVK